MPIPEIRLTPEDKATLEALEADIVALDKELIKAEEAGLDVVELKADLEKAKKLRKGLLKFYG